MKIKIAREIKMKNDGVWSVTKIKESTVDLEKEDQLEIQIYDEFFSNEDLVKISFEKVK